MNRIAPQTRQFGTDTCSFEGRLLMRWCLCWFLCVLALSSVGAGLDADTTQWKRGSATPGDWFDNANWTAGVPSADTHTYIDNGTAMIAAGSALADDVYVGETAGQTAAVQQTGGSLVTVSPMYVGYQDNSAGFYTMSGTGSLDTSTLYLGYWGQGTFTHSAGVNAPRSLTMGHKAGSRGTYVLSGSAALTPDGAEVIGRQGEAYFTHTGGTNTSGLIEIGGWDDPASSGTYTLSDNGVLSGGTVVVGHAGSGLIDQSGGTADIQVLRVHTNGTYRYTGGALTLSEQFWVQGTFDAGNQPVTVNLPESGLVDLTVGGTFLGTGQTLLNCGPKTLVVYNPGSPPLSFFGQFTTSGFLHTPGSTLVIPVGRSIVGFGFIEGQVQVQGTLEGAPTIHGELNIDNGARAELDAVRLNGLTSRMDGVTLSCRSMTVGYSDAGAFTQSTGNVTIDDDLSLGYYAAGTSGIYTLSGGALEVAEMNVGRVYFYSGIPKWSRPGTLRITDPDVSITIREELEFGPLGRLEAVAGATVHMKRKGDGSPVSFIIRGTDPDNLDDLARIRLAYYTCDQAWFPDTLEIAGMDLGRDVRAFDRNFALGTVSLGDNSLVFLEDAYENGNRNGPGGAAEALYLFRLELAATAQIDLNGLHLYLRQLDDNGGTITNGDLISMVPGDSDGDWKVDGADLAAWQQNYDPLGLKGDNNTFAMGDWNGDNNIDGGDLALWQQNYDPLGLDGSGAAYIFEESLTSGADAIEPIPEPGSVLLLGTGLMMILTRTGTRRR